MSIITAILGSFNPLKRASTEPTTTTMVKNGLVQTAGVVIKDTHSWTLPKEVNNSWPSTLKIEFSIVRVEFTEVLGKKLMDVHARSVSPMMALLGLWIRATIFTKDQ